jgi:hypothetical protein
MRESWVVRARNLDAGERGRSNARWSVGRMAKKKRPPRKKKTMQVDPRWLEEVQILPAKTAEVAKKSDPPAAGAKVSRRMTMEVDPAWLEEFQDSLEGAPVGGPVSPPPLPPPVELAAAPKRRFAAPIPREEMESQLPPPPAPRRGTTKPPPRRTTKPPRA